MRQTHWRLGPYSPQHGQVLPTQFRTLPFEFVRSHTFPKQERAENLSAMERVLAGRPGMPQDVMFLPKQAFQGPGSGANGLEPVSREARRLAALQAHVLANYLQGGTLAPAAARELAHMRVSAAPDYIAMAREQNRRAGGLPAGAHQIPYDPRDRQACAITNQVRQQVMRYGVARAAFVPDLLPARRARSAMMARMLGVR